jgi:hypothetical protein
VKARTASICVLRTASICVLRAACVLLFASASSAAAQVHVLIITGASGEAKYAQSFHQSAVSLATALVDRHGVARERITYLAEDPARDATRIDGKSSKAEVTKAIARIAAEARAGHLVMIVLIGHGSHAGSESRFNLPGPDLTAAELAMMLDPITSAEVAVINTTSASGDFLPVLSGRNRIVITATKSSYERNETLFPHYFVAAFSAPGADTDKDERVSLLEAFTFARHEVARAYESDTRLLTEHAMLDDDGDRKGSATPDPRTGDGARARRFILGGDASRATAANAAPVSEAILAKRAALEARIDSLRRRKDTMAAETYDRELERLLLELARLSQSRREGTP